jgi:hypothetical protein
MTMEQISRGNAANAQGRDRAGKGRSEPHLGWSLPLIAYLIISKN